MNGFFLAVARSLGQLTAPRERHGMEVGLFVVSSVVALHFMWVNMHIQGMYFLREADILSRKTRQPG